LSRPEKFDAMTGELVAALHSTLDRIAVDRSVGAIVLTGAGRGFCSGLDLGGYGAAPDTAGRGHIQSNFAEQKHIATLISHMRSLQSTARPLERARSDPRLKPPTLDAQLRWYQGAAAKTCSKRAVFQG